MDNYELGQKIGSLSTKVDGLAEDVKIIRANVEHLDRWKAKVVGASIACSAFISAVFEILAHLSK